MVEVAAGVGAEDMAIIKHLLSNNPRVGLSPGSTISMESGIRMTPATPPNNWVRACRTCTRPRRLSTIKLAYLTTHCLVLMFFWYILFYWYNKDVICLNNDTEDSNEDWQRYYEQVMPTRRVVVGGRCPWSTRVGEFLGPSEVCSSHNLPDIPECPSFSDSEIVTLLRLAPTFQATCLCKSTHNLVLYKLLLYDALVM